MLAVLDIGTNSVLLLVARTQGEQIVEILGDRCEITRLGEGVDRTVSLAEEPMRRTLKVAAGLRREADALGAQHTWVITTSAVRDASNREQFLDRVRTQVGGEVELLSGEEEARRAFLGVQSNPSFRSSPLLVMDVGGGSTEVILGAEGRIERALSLDIGCVRLTERLLSQNPVSDQALEQALDFARGFLSPHLQGRETQRRLLVGTGGTATTLAAVDQELDPYDREKVDGHMLAAGRVQALVDGLRRMDLKARSRVLGMPPGRADVIVGGAVIFLAALQVWVQDRMAVSDRGVRYGTLLTHLGEMH